MCRWSHRPPKCEQLLNPQKRRVDQHSLSCNFLGEVLVTPAISHHNISMPIQLIPMPSLIAFPHSSACQWHTVSSHMHDQYWLPACIHFALYVLPTCAFLPCPALDFLHLHIHFAAFLVVGPVCMFSRYPGPGCLLRLRATTTSSLGLTTSSD